MSASAGSGQSRDCLAQVDKAGLHARIEKLENDRPHPALEQLHAEQRLIAPGLTFSSPAALVKLR
jgi:hypothetical protein